ncbi:DC1 - like 10 [Theobroma cacao]|nr:DC1 - like 10 [Theobroma cacao]
MRQNPIHLLLSLYITNRSCKCLIQQKSTKKSLPSIPRSMNTEFDHGATTLKVDGKVSIEKVMEQGESKQGSPEFLSELGGTIDTRIYKSGQLKVLNPLHPHPLSLLTRYPDILPGRFICDECGDISEGFLYFCFECRQFKVDVKCGGLSGPRNQGQRLKEMDRKTKISHVNHEHMLVLGNAKKGHYCSYCQLEIFGLAYCCLDCDDIYILHESCLDFPEKMQHPFHPLHLLVVNRNFYELCHFCDYGTLAIVYSCFECDLHLHVPCLNSLRQALRFKFGTHKLDFYYIGIGSQMLKEMIAWSSYSVEEVLSLLVPRARKNSVELEEKIENRLKGINDRLGQ